MTCECRADGTNARVGVSDGFAVVLAAAEIQSQFGVVDSSLVDVVGVHLDDPDHMGTPNGYLVSLKDESWLYLIVVSFEGEAGGASRVPLTALSPSDDGEGVG